MLILEDETYKILEYSMSDLNVFDKFLFSGNIKTTRLFFFLIESSDSAIHTNA